MPYIVTTKRPGTKHPSVDALALGLPPEPSVSRRAVATLEEACTPFATPPDGRDESMAERVDRANTYDYLRLWTPGTAPLTRSDETVIEVEPATWDDLDPTWGAHDTAQSVCDAYNARQG